MAALGGVSNGCKWTMMRHGRKIHRLGRPADQRKALLRALTTQLLTHGAIETTKTKAKAVRPWIDKMVNLAKDGSDAKKNQARLEPDDAHRAPPPAGVATHARAPPARADLRRLAPTPALRAGCARGWLQSAPKLETLKQTLHAAPARCTLQTLTRHLLFAGVRLDLRQEDCERAV